MIARKERSQGFVNTYGRLETRTLEQASKQRINPVGGLRPD
jgi:hypothetical protein